MNRPKPGAVPSVVKSRRESLDSLVLDTHPDLYELCEEQLDLDHSVAAGHADPDTTLDELHKTYLFAASIAEHMYATATLCKRQIVLHKVFLVTLWLFAISVLLEVLVLGPPGANPPNLLSTINTFIALATLLALVLFIPFLLFAWLRRREYAIRRQLAPLLAASIARLNPSIDDLDIIIDYVRSEKNAINRFISPARLRKLIKTHRQAQNIESLRAP